MAYIGYPVSLEEAIRLTTEHIQNQNESPELIQCANDFNRILKMFTLLRFYWIDKNQSILGLEVKDIACQFWTLLSVDEAILKLLETKLKCKEEITRLQLNLSTVTFCHMEEEDTVHENPEPCIFFASF
jgi:hypothetical protein